MARATSSMWCSAPITTRPTTIIFISTWDRTGPAGRSQGPVPMQDQMQRSVECVAGRLAHLCSPPGQDQSLAKLDRVLGRHGDGHLVPDPLLVFFRRRCDFDHYHRILAV